MAEAFTQEKKVKERPARKKLKFFAHYEPAELALMEQLYSSTLNEITEDEIIKGRIVSISNKDVTIDVGFKSEGIVSLLEFRAEDEVKVGDDVEVYLENIEDKMGQLILSKKKADVLRIWDRIYDSIENDTIINGVAIPKRISIKQYSCNKNNPIAKLILIVHGPRPLCSRGFRLHVCTFLCSRFFLCHRVYCAQ
jgi:small subunit ribosomal protein S1